MSGRRRNALIVRVQIGKPGQSDWPKRSHLCTPAPHWQRARSRDGVQRRGQAHCSGEYSNGLGGHRLCVHPLESNGGAPKRNGARAGSSRYTNNVIYKLVYKFPNRFEHVPFTARKMSLGLAWVEGCQNADADARRASGQGNWGSSVPQRPAGVLHDLSRRGVPRHSAWVGGESSLGAKPSST